MDLGDGFACILCGREPSPTMNRDQSFQREVLNVIDIVMFSTSGFADVPRRGRPPGSRNGDALCR